MGLGDELKGHNYGAALADALSKIGQSVKEARQTSEAQDIIREHIPKLITGDMGSADFRQRFAETLATAASMLPDVGEKVTGAVGSAVSINKMREAQMQAGLKAAKDEYDVSYQGYVQALKTPNADKLSLESWHEDLLKEQAAIAGKYPGYESYFGTPPPPVPVRDKSAVDFQQKGLTEYGALTAGYDKKANRMMVTLADGKIVPYDQRIHGRILQTAVPRSISEVEGSLTPEAANLAAHEFLSTGHMPTGVRSAVSSSIVLNEAAKILANAGIDLKDAPALQSTYKALSASLSRLMQQQTMVKTFEQTAEKNVTLALARSSEVPRWNSPVANKVILWWKRNIGGDEKVAAFEASLRVAATEIAKVTSTVTGNQLAQQQIEEFNHLMETSLSMKQFKSVFDVLKYDMASRLSSYKDEIKRLKDELTSPYLDKLYEDKVTKDGKVYIKKGGEWHEVTTPSDLEIEEEPEE